MALKQLVSARLIMKGSGKHCAGGIIQDQEKKLKKKSFCSKFLCQFEGNLGFNFWLVFDAFATKKKIFFHL